ncbi:MAG: EcsC family protein [Nocardioidaceae bacterium]|nr:EcsC family protein [Nocardioidaceae bacterium]
MAEDSTHTGLTRMSDYEAKAWQAAINALERKSSRRRLPRRLRKVGSQAQELAATSWDRAPGTESMEQLFGRAIHGLRVLTFDPALNSVDVAKVERRYAAQHPDVGSLADVQLLDLRVCDTALPRVRARYAAMAAGQGGATAVAVTGAVVSSTVTGGVTASAAIAAVAADAAATLAFMGRITALVAAHYGYDVREPEEEVFALGVLSLASAGIQGGKTQTLRSLSRLTQQMMRQATWTQLRGHQLVGVIEKVYLALGFQLAKTKLAQAVPVAGVVLNAGLSAQLADQTFRRAGDARTACASCPRSTASTPRPGSSRPLRQVRTTTKRSSTSPRSSPARWSMCRPPPPYESTKASGAHRTASRWTASSGWSRSASDPTSPPGREAGRTTSSWR